VTGPTAKTTRFSGEKASIPFFIPSVQNFGGKTVSAEEFPGESFHQSFDLIFCCVRSTCRILPV